MSPEIKRAPESKDETDTPAESFDPVLEMDKVAQPLIIKVGKMALKTIIVASVISVTVALTPVMGVAADPTGDPELQNQVVEHTLGIVTDDSEAQELTKTEKAKALAGKSITWVKEGIAKQYRGIMDDDTKIAELKRRNEILHQMYLMEKTEKEALAVMAQAQHRGVLNCSKRVSLYLETLKLPE